jgi:hypothetical protein
MVNLLEGLLGGGQQRQNAENFANRYANGSPYEGYTGQEAAGYYQQIAPQMPQDQYLAAAEQAAARMSPEERMQFGQYLEQQAAQQGLSFPPGMQMGMGGQQYQNPGALAQMMGHMHQQQPGILGQLLGGGQGGQSGGMNPLAKAMLGGIAAMAVKNMMSGKL